MESKMLYNKKADEAFTAIQIILLLLVFVAMAAIVWYLWPLMKAWIDRINIFG